MSGVNKRRPGGQKGNKNAFKHGRRGDDLRFAVVWQSFTAEQQEFLRPLVKKHGSELPGMEELLAQEKIIPIQRPIRSQTPQLQTHTETDESNDSRPYADFLARRVKVLEELKGILCLGAEGLVDQHGPVLDILEEGLEELRVMSEQRPDQAISNKGAWIRHYLHERVMVRTGRLVQCPYCAKKEYILAGEPGMQERQTS